MQKAGHSGVEGGLGAEEPMRTGVRGEGAAQQLSGRAGAAATST